MSCGGLWWCCMVICCSPCFLRDCDLVSTYCMRSWQWCRSRFWWRPNIQHADSIGYWILNTNILKEVSVLPMLWLAMTAYPRLRSFHTISDRSFDTCTVKSRTGGYTLIIWNHQSYFHWWTQTILLTAVRAAHASSWRFLLNCLGYVRFLDHVCQLNRSIQKFWRRFYDTIFTRQ